ncbi:MAG TPA: GNAT family N-acetyltransferase [Polyangia bacterium]|jgi:N-acyl-L-homoserine lactone synthetase
METRRAETAEEREAIARLTYDIYVDEMGWDDIGDRERRTVTFPDDASARFVYATDEGKVVGAIRVQLGADGPFTAETEQTYDLGRFAGVAAPAEMAVLTRLMARPEHRAGFVPFALMAAAAELAVRQGVQLFFCDCQPHLLNLYTKVGFRTYARCFSHPIVGLMIPLVAAPLDVEHQRRIGSPFLALAEQHHRPSPIPALLDQLLATGEATTRISGQDEAARWVAEYEQACRQTERRVGLFDGMPQETIARILDRGSILDCRAGDRIIRKGVADRTLYVILQGTVEIRVGEQVTDVATRGDVIGEIAYLMQAPRTANVYAATDDVRIVSLREKALAELREGNPDVAARLFENLSRILCQKLVSLHRRHLV